MGEKNISEGAIYTSSSSPSGLGWGVCINARVPVPLESRGFDVSECLPTRLVNTHFGEKAEESKHP